MAKPDNSHKHQLVAIMFTDIVGYTALMNKDEQKALSLLKINREIHEKSISQYNGKMLKEMGDGILVSFQSTSDAVYCAGLLMYEASRESDLHLRIGIHEGDVVVSGNDVFGDGVNIASRIEELADPDEILVSESVKNNIKNKEGISTDSIGEKALKNVEEVNTLYSVSVSEDFIKNEEETPTSSEKKKNGKWKFAGIVIGVLIILLLIVNILYFDPSGQSIASIEDKSIAVLPFRDLSAEQKNQYFADGIMDAVLNDLSRIGELKVIPSTSVEQYRTTTKTAKEIGNELEVAFLLEGSSQVHGEKVRITTRLIDAKNEAQIWSNNYDRKLEDIFLIQSEIAGQVGIALKNELTISDKELLQSTPTSNFEAYDVYLRGKEYANRYFNKRDSSVYQIANNLYRQSIDEDPNFALAYIGIADLYLTRNYFKEYMDDNPLDSVLQLCNQALQIDPELAEAYTLRGKYNYWIKNDFESAIRDLNKAIEINPNNVPAMDELADIYSRENRYVESYKILMKASSFSRGGDQLDIWGSFGGIYMHIGDYEKAVEYVNEILRLQPDDVGAYGFLSHINRCNGNFAANLEIAEKLLAINPEGRALYHVAVINMMNGRYEDSEKYFRQLYSSSPDIINLNGYGDKHMFAYVLIQNGKEEEAKQHLEEIIEFMHQIVEKNKQWSNNVGYELAKAYSLLGEKDEAIRWLEYYLDHTFEAGLHDFAKYDPPFDNIRDDPRFEEIIRQAGIQVAEKRKEIELLEQEYQLKSYMNK